jgi:signal transduction histidine kinase
VELLVQDDGPGVDAVAADDIFQPGRTSETGAGAGLGLAISRRIARSAGGDVHVVTADVGSDGGRFVVRLPLA